MKYVVLDGRTPKAAVDSLKARGFSPILLPCFSRLAAPVSAHPDMLIFFGDRIFCSTEYYLEAKNEIDLIKSASKLELTLSGEKISKDYPEDIAYNALVIGGHLFGKLANLCPDIIEYANRAELSCVNVNQGYTKCSVCKISEDAMITSDRSIKKAALARGIDVLEIRPGHIGLSGYGFGFIGGASGADENNVYFCGSLSSHPDGEAMESFCKKHKKEAVSLSDEPLYDIGTIFFI